MSSQFKILILIITLFAAGAFAQSPSQPQAAKAAASGPAPTPTSLKDAELRKLWTFYNDQALGDLIFVFKKKNQNHPQIKMMDDPKVKQKIRAYFYDRFAKIYGDAMSLEEITYLNKLYASDLMKRVSASDIKIWEDNLGKLDKLFKEAIKAP